MIVNSFIQRRVPAEERPQNSRVLSLGEGHTYEAEEPIYQPKIQYWEPNFVLDEKDPSLRLNKMQSHIGQISIQSPEAVLWQADDNFEMMIERGTVFNKDTLKRPVLKFSQGILYITLKYFDQVDKLYIGSRSNSNYQIQLNSGKIVEADTGRGNNALLLYRLSSGEIELRCEVINSTDLVTVFGLNNLS